MTNLSTNNKLLLYFRKNPNSFLYCGGCSTKVFNSTLHHYKGMCVICGCVEFTNNPSICHHDERIEITDRMMQQQDMLNQSTVILYNL